MATVPAGSRPVGQPKSEQNAVTANFDGSLKTRPYGKSGENPAELRGQMGKSAILIELQHDFRQFRSTCLAEILGFAWLRPATEASARIASEARSALDGAFTESAAALSQAARSAVVAAENLRWPWWQYLFVILAAGLLSAICTAWMMSRSNETVYQISREDQQLIDEGRMLEHVWPRLSRAEQKRVERLTAQP
jgi:hypothetical protein